MAHHKLSDRACRAYRTGLHGDGGGLYLSINNSKTAARSWLFVYRVGDKRTELGLGPYPTISLHRARELASELRTARANGIIDLKVWRKTRQPLGHTGKTFGAAAQEMLAAKKPGWSAKHIQQWTKSLMHDAASLHAMPIAAVDTEAILAVLQPHWLRTPESALRLRLRLEGLLDYAKAREWRSGENPARWKGHLKNLLPRQNRQVEHFAAMPYGDLPKFLAKVRGREGYGALALALCILTATRTAEVIGARWEEFDFKAKVWTIPADRMKGRREHRIPLSTAALDVLRELGKVRRGHFLIPAPNASKHASKAVMDHVVKRAGERVTVHGFRSTFRDWAGEQTSFPSNVIEMALSHVIGSAVERAYARSDLFAKRHQLMQLWADHCTGAVGKVIPLRR
jgi:integrase